MKIKCCGLMHKEDISYANELVPDYVGFILCKGFKRTVTPATAKALIQDLRADITPVGVFLNDTLDDVISTALMCGLKAIQLHGNENQDYIRSLQDATRIPVIQVFRGTTREAFMKVNESVADLCLLDSGTGTGKGLDLSLIQGVRRPFLLAGGLTPDNICEAIKKVHPYGVDVSSGIETDGRKDYLKMKQFIENVRRMD